MPSGSAFARPRIRNDAGPRHRRMILDYLQHQPHLGAGANVAGRGVVIGRSTIGARPSLADYATVRADGENTRIGAGANVAGRGVVMGRSTSGARPWLAGYATVDHCMRSMAVRRTSRVPT